MTSVPEVLENVKVPLKANIYFDGNVISHTLLLPDGTKKTLGLIRVGNYEFNTDAAERMEILAGSCQVLIKGGSNWKVYEAGAFFDVPAKSGFQIKVQQGLVEYLCSFEAKQN